MHESSLSLTRTSPAAVTTVVVALLLSLPVQPLMQEHFAAASHRFGHYIKHLTPPTRTNENVGAHRRNRDGAKWHSCSQQSHFVNFELFSHF